jgi:outer membrane protein TolC
VAKDLPSFNLGFAASWELDIWGRLRSATKAALFQYLATVDGKNFLVTRLVAEMAAAYYEIRALHKKVEILEQNIQIQQQALEIMRLQKRAARVTELAVKRFEAEVLKNQSRRYLLKQNIVERENALNFLAGRFPQSIALDPTDFIQLIPQGIQAGVPAKLLENRSDVRQAGLQLKAAKMSVDSARARFYPALSIEAGAGFQSFNANHFFSTPDSLFYNLGANLTAPLLNRQGIKADYFSAGSKQLQAVYNYERAILQAYTEVANQLNKVENLKNTFKLKSDQVAALEESVSISNTLFRAARCDYMEVLLTRRDFLEAQMELVEVKHYLARKSKS